MITRKRKKAIIITTAVILVAAVFVVAWVNHRRLTRIWNRIADPDAVPPMAVEVSRKEFPVKGIDVSHHNGNIDFERVAADSVEFVMIKATEGVSHTDTCMARNYDHAVAAGLKVGFYHFFRFDRGGVKQGRHFLAATSGRPVQLPLVIDVEISGNGDVDYYKAIGRLRDMIGYLRRHDCRVMIYCNSKTYDKYIRGNFDDAELWLASENTPRDNGDSRELWQHSHAGHVKGISTPVDINTFNGNRKQFQKWLLRSKAKDKRVPCVHRHTTAIPDSLPAPRDTLDSCSVISSST